MQPKNKTDKDDKGSKDAIANQWAEHQWEEQEAQQGQETRQTLIFPMNRT